ENFWIDHIVGDQAAGRLARVGLGGWRHVDLKQTTAGEESRAGGAPCGSAGERAGDRRVLFGLQLRRQRVDGEVVGDHVVRDLRAAANCPTTATRRIPRETDMWTDVVGVGFRL